MITAFKMFMLAAEEMNFSCDSGTACRECYQDIDGYSASNSLKYATQKNS
ncbi:MAG: hypothetical protein IJR85_10105 [Synergistaceae bacterium]|nr:hypothetical protein [Synergistaceae bacterium]